MDEAHGPLRLSSMPPSGSLTLPTSSGPAGTGTMTMPPLGESGLEAGAASTSIVPTRDTHPHGTILDAMDKGGLTKGEKKAEPFALAESLPIIPATLVDKIVKGQYVDLCDLLQDNILLAKRAPIGERNDTDPGSGHTRRHKKREFTRDEAGLLSWTQCFAVYTAIVCSQNPDRINDLLAYMVTMINEGRRFKFQGWLTYYEMFRQSVVKSKSTSWAQLNGTLYATTFLSQQKGESVTCQKCASPDHYTYQCAFYERTSSQRAVSPGARRKRPRSRSPEKGPSTGTCYAWNDGRCNRGSSCKWKHNMCLKCGEEHKAIHCSTYKKKKSDN